MDMNRLEIYDKVNQCETLQELSLIILDLADADGMIQGRTQKFNAGKMAARCLIFKQLPSIYLTREFGIRQQALYIINNEKNTIS